MKYETQLFGGQTCLHCMKQTLRNEKSNSHGGIRLAVFIATVFAVFMLTACSDGNGTKSFRSGDEAIREYHGFLTTLRQGYRPIVGKDHQRMARVGRFRVIVHLT